MFGEDGEVECRQSGGGEIDDDDPRSPIVTRSVIIASVGGVCPENRTDDERSENIMGILDNVKQGGGALEGMVKNLGVDQLLAKLTNLQDPSTRQAAVDQWKKEHPNTALPEEVEALLAKK